MMMENQLANIATRQKSAFRSLPRVDVNVLGEVFSFHIQDADDLKHRYVIELTNKQGYALTDAKQCLSKDTADFFNNLLDPDQTPWLNDWILAKYDQQQADRKLQHQIDAA